MAVLREHFPERRISIRGNLEWPGRSPDLAQQQQTANVTPAMLARVKTNARIRFFFSNTSVRLMRGPHQNLWWNMEVVCLSCAYCVLNVLFSIASWIPNEVDWILVNLLFWFDYLVLCDVELRRWSSFINATCAGIFSFTNCQQVLGFRWLSSVSFMDIIYGVEYFGEKGHHNSVHFVFKAFPYSPKYCYKHTMM